MRRLIGNLYAHNYERNPMFKGGARGQVLNNLIYNPGQRGVHYNLIAEEWLGHPYSSGEVVMRGNVLRAGPSTQTLAFFMVGGSGPLRVYADDNCADASAIRCRSAVATPPRRLRSTS